MDLQIAKKSWTGLTAESATLSAADSVIRRNLRVEGKLSFSGNLQVDGEIHGMVVSMAGSASLLTLGESGVIEGEVDVASAVIHGRIKGNVHSSQHLTLTSKAVIHGDVKYTELEIAQGAVVDGRLIFEGDSRGS